MPESEKGAKKEKSAGAVIYYTEEKEPKFLLLKYKTYWGFAKGIIEAGESIEETVGREVKEETGLDNLKIMPGFRYVQTWFYRFEGGLVRKEAIFLLIKVTENEAENVKISFEHEDFRWLNYEDALNQMKIKNNKEMLKKAYDFIKEHEMQKRLKF